MFFYTAFWAVALLLIAANAGTDAAAQAGVSKRQVIGDEYKGLLQSMDHKVSTARRLLRGFGATQGERTKRILDSIEEATGPAGLLMEFNNAHDSQIDSIMRVLLEAELIGTQVMYPPPYGMYPPPYGMYPPPYGMYPPPYGAFPPPYEMPSPMYRHRPPPAPPPMPPSPPNPPPMYRHQPPEEPPC